MSVTISGSSGVTLNDTSVLATMASSAVAVTATSTTAALTAGTAQYHPGVAKFWVSASSTGGLNGSYNVANITKGAGGIYQINFTTAFANTNYTTVANPIFTPTGTSSGVRFVNTYSYAVGSVTVWIGDTAYAGIDTPFTAVGHGTQ